MSKISFGPRDCFDCPSLLILFFCTIIATTFCLLVYCPAGQAAERVKITGEYQYTYGDSESLTDAKAKCYSMAVRSALESYKTFVTATSTVKDYQLVNDLIQTISSGYIEDLRVIKKTVNGRTIYTKIEGYIVPSELTKILKAQLEHKVPERDHDKELAIINRDIEEINNYNQAELNAAQDDFFYALEAENNNLQLLQEAIQQYRAIVERVYQSHEDSYKTWLNETSTSKEYKIVKLAMLKSKQVKNKELQAAYQDYYNTLSRLRDKARGDVERKKGELKEFERNTAKTSQWMDEIIRQEEIDLNKLRH